LANKEWLISTVFSRFQEPFYGLNAGLVQINPSKLTRFLFLDFNRITGLEISNLAGLDSQKVTGSEIGVDSDGKKSKVSRTIRN
jgi:hypothetical protein